MPRTEYDWQIGEDKWQAEPPADDQQIAHPGLNADTRGEAATKPRRLRLRIVLAVFALVGLSATVVLLHFVGRAGEITASVTQDVLAAHELVLRAAAESDMELLDALIEKSGGWDEIRRYLLQQPSPFERAPFGLYLQTADPQRVQISPSPDLKRAEVATEYAYTIHAGRGVTETVRLRQTALYRFDYERWLLVQPGHDFWGGLMTSEGRWLTVIYPEQDESIGKRLAGDLDAVLGELCADQTDIKCPADFHVQLRLDQSPTTVARLFGGGTAPAYMFGTGAYRIDLPTPTLIGLPTDEASYQALYRGYATRVVEAVVIVLAGRQSSGGSVSPFSLDKRLIDLELRPWPLAAEDELPIAAPLPLLNQDIAVLCIEGIAQESSLYRYSPSTDTWVKELSNRNFVWLSRSPDQDGVILQERLGSAGQITSRIRWWRNGSELPLLDTSANVWLDSGLRPTRAPDHTLLVFTYANAAREAIRPPNAVTQIDLSQCASTGCATRSTPVSGFPVFSPDGAQLLVWGWDGDPVYRVDANGQMLAQIDNGLYPFWLDNETYGYVRWSGAPMMVVWDAWEVVTASGQDDTIRLILRGQDLQAALPESNRSGWSIPGIGPVTVSPTNPDLLVIAAYATHEGLQPNWPGRSYVFVFDRRLGMVSLRLAFDPGGWLFFAGFSPDGRWLIANGLDSTLSSWSIILHDITRRETRTFISLSRPGYLLAAPEYDWSADGQWLLILDDGVLRLAAPDFDYERTIVPESPGCTHAAWINRPWQP